MFTNNNETDNKNLINAGLDIKLDRASTANLMLSIFISGSLLILIYYFVIIKKR